VIPMTLYDLKPRFQRALMPFVLWLARAGVTPNKVTIAAAVISVAVGLFVAARAETRTVFLLIPLWLLLRMALNAIDGMLAIELDRRTPLGAYLNELGDVVADAALYAPFALVAPFSPLAVAVVIFLAALAELAGALGPMVGSARRYDGPMGKSDRALVFGALGLAIGTGVALPGWAAWIMPLLAALIVLTIVNRIRSGVRTARWHA